MSDTKSKFSLSTDQKLALQAITDWLRSPTDALTLGGYAGTGKTTLLGIIRKILSLDAKNNKVRIAFASYTGRATQNLNNKLQLLKALHPNDSCSTIHSLLYYQIVDSKGMHQGWKKRAKLEYDLIVIDEASMVTREVWRDLLSYKIPILAVGDHGQLPPIGDSFNLMQQPALTLEHIHRQAAGNPILDLATQARMGEPIKHQSYSDFVKKMKPGSDAANDIIENTLAMANNETLLLVGRNKTRVNLNSQTRVALGFETSEPTVRDKVVCLRNNYDNTDGPIYNGMVGFISQLRSKDEKWYQADINFPDDGRSYSGQISKQQFGAVQTLNKLGTSPRDNAGDLFDFGYALTVHKAQGSQARKVLLFDESWCFKEDAPKWLYTAITRAEEELYIVG